MSFSPLPIFFTARLSGYSFGFCVEAIRLSHGFPFLELLLSRWSNMYIVFRSSEFIIPMLLS
jgi:hypothetical protein